MKKLLLSLFLLGVCSLPFTARAAEGPAAQISVSGSAEVKVQPDEILMSVGVESRDEKLDVAKKDNDEQIAKALAFLKQSKIPEKNIQTDFLSVDPGYDHHWPRTRPVVFTVRKSIQLRITDLSKFEGLVSGLLTNGVTTIHGIQFRTTELRKFRDQARAMAIRAAQEKADDLLKELGAKRGKVLSIQANDYGAGSWGGSGWWGGGGYNMMANTSQNVASAPGGSEDGPTMSLGQISVSATVHVSFQINH